MINELLDPGFLRARAKVLYSLLEPTGPDSERRTGDEEEISEQERTVALVAFEKAIASLANEASGEPCFSHDPYICALQSALERLYHERLPDEIVTATPGRRADESITGESLREPPAPEDDRRLGEAYSTSDIEWVSCVFAKAVMLMDRKHDFVGRAAEPVAIGDNARLVIFGDWGSGLPAAVRVSNVARAKLLEGQEAGKDSHAVHLGDVYYSGWDSEYRDHVLRHWPVDDGEPFGSWMLNANHDMFSGGHGYFQVLQDDRRFAKQMGSSEFVLRNKDWNFIGLDTAWEENTLSEEQCRWALAQRTPGRGTILLSHHYLFSGYEKKPLKIPEIFRDALAKEKLEGWIWGHEHRAAIYHPRPEVEVGMCIGHGGVPVKVWPLTRKRPASCKYVFKDKAEGQGGWWRKFGLAVVDCSPEQLSVILYDDDGVEKKTEIIKRL